MSWSISDAQWEVAGCDGAKIMLRSATGGSQWVADRDLYLLVTSGKAQPSEAETVG